TKNRSRRRDFASLGASTRLQRRAGGAEILRRRAANTPQRTARRAVRQRERDEAQPSWCRASITRLAAITEPHVYARNDRYERHAQRSQPKLRLRKEMMPSMPARKWRSRW